MDKMIQAAIQGHAATDAPIQLSSLKDVSTETLKDSPLLSFIAPRFKQVVDRSLVQKRFSEGQKQLTAPVKLCTAANPYPKANGSPNLVGCEEDTSLDSADCQRLAQKKFVTVEISVKTSFLGIKSSLGVDFEVVRGDGLVYPIVVKSPSDRLLFKGKAVLSYLFSLASI